MRHSPVTVSLPTEDRKRAYEFYLALGFEAIGELADDGVPEPLQFELNDGIRIMFIPTGGFGWVTAGREVAEPGHAECLLTLPAGSQAEVDEIIEQARRAGAEIVTEPAQQAWGYTGTFADPDGHLWSVEPSE